MHYRVTSLCACVYKRLKLQSFGHDSIAQLFLAKTLNAHPFEFQLENQQKIYKCLYAFFMSNNKIYKCAAYSVDNVDNCAYPLSTCAERVALTKAVSGRI